MVVKEPTTRVNYVIATYAGTKCVTDRERFLHLGIHPKDYLKVHLRKLIDTPHKLTQITIMKAEVPNGIASWEGYYDIDDLVTELSKTTVVKTFSVPNQGISYGQYIRSYEFCKKDTPFDYWILMEDDYVPVLPNFDSVLVKIHKELLPRQGVLCAWASKASVGIYHAAHSLCVVDEKSMAKTFANPAAQMRRLISIQRPCRCQILFSQMFTNIGIPMTDYTGLYHTPYWTGALCVDCSSNEPVNSSAIFVPLQMVTVGQMTTTAGESVNATINDLLQNINFGDMPKHIRITQNNNKIQKNGETLPQKNLHRMANRLLQNRLLQSKRK